MQKPNKITQIIPMPRDAHDPEPLGVLAVTAYGELWHTEDWVDWFLLHRGAFPTFGESFNPSLDGEISVVLTK
jgi:hypothetical protein